MHEAHMLTLLRQIRDCMCFSFSSHHISWTFRLPLITPAPSRPGRHAVIWTLTVLEGNNKWDDRQRATLRCAREDLGHVYALLPCS